MEERSESAESTLPLRCKKPKILTVDLPISLAKRLRAAGYNVLPGTFGRPYKVRARKTIIVTHRLFGG
jgi:hypothetical protein